MCNKIIPFRDIFEKNFILKLTFHGIRHTLPNKTDFIITMLAQNNHL